MLRVDVDGLDLAAGDDDLGFWEVDKLEGWWNAPAAKSQSAPRANSHGDYRLPVQYEARIITVEGAFVASSPAVRTLGMERISGLLPYGFGRMAVALDGRSSFAEIERFGEPEITLVGGQLIEYQVQFKAADPRRFGAVQAVSAGAGTATAVQNRGNSPAYPLIVVEGPVTAGGYTVTGPGGELFTVTTSPGSGTTHLIDMHDGLLRVNGSMATGAGLVARADVFTIPPGSKVNVTLSKGGRVELYDTYM